MRKTTLLLLALFSVSSSAIAASSYVSDDLHTFIHSGSSAKYKIIGSVNSGEQINIINTNKNTGFTLIKDLKGRSGWINSKYISNIPSLKERVPKLELELTNLNKIKSSLEDDAKARNKQVENLQKTNTKLNKQLEEIQALNDNLNSKLDTKKNDLLMTWFTYGGIVGGIGLLLGLLLPILMPSRNRSKRRW